MIAFKGTHKSEPSESIRASQFLPSCLYGRMC